MDRLLTAQSFLRKLYREGPKFRKYLTELQNSYTFSPMEFDAYQRRLLRNLVHHCYRRIPYYREVFRQHGLRPEDIETPADLAQLPYLDKQTVRKHFPQLIDRIRLLPWCHQAKTSGTTGYPGTFIRDHDTINFEHAAVWRHWLQAGDLRKRRVTIRDNPVVPMEQSEPPFWHYDWVHNELRMCAYHLSKKTCRSYLEKILEFKPSVLYTTPSLAVALAQIFRAHRVHYQFDLILTSSENLTPEISTYIQQVFNAPIADWYDQAERVAAIATCPQGTYHILEDYSIVELIDTPYGQEIVGTQLRNRVMPLLRYRTGDYVTSTDVHCACGSHFRTIKNIVGRQNQYLLTPEGYRIFNMAPILVGVDHLLETQFIQQESGKVLIKVLTDEHFSQADQAGLIAKTRQYTSSQMEVSIEKVDQIPRNAHGKFPGIINQMEIPS